MPYRKGQRVRWRNAFDRLEEGKILKRYKNRHDGLLYLVVKCEDGSHAELPIPLMLKREVKER